MSSALKTVAPPAPAFARRAVDLPGKGILAANLALVAVAVGLLRIDLFGRGSLSTLTPVIGVMVLVALGQAFVIGTGGIDLSIPSTVTLVGVILLKSAGGENAALPRALLLCLAACVLVGLVNGVLVELLRLDALVVTLATGQLIAGATRIYRGQALAVTRVPERLSELTRASVGDISVILLVALAVSVLVAAWLKRHTSGRRLAASSVARSAAESSGLAATRQRITAWVIATVLVGIGAALLAGQITTPDLTLGTPYLLTSIVAVVLGGAAITGGRVRVAATVLGALFIVLLNHVFRVQGFSSGVSLAVQGLVLGVGLALVAATKHTSWRSLRAPAATADGPSTPGEPGSPKSQE